MSVITHYGVKGMRWGVRKDRESKKKSKSLNNMDRKELINLIRSGKSFTVDRHDKLYRATNEPGEEKGRLYVSPRKDDLRNYATNMDAIGGTFDKDVYAKMYTLKKDLKVAGIKTQANELYRIFKEPNLKNIKTERDLVKYYYNRPNTDAYVNFDILNKKTKERDQMIKSLKKKGYDAAVDLTDVVIAYSDCPLVVLDSETTLGKTFVDKYFEAKAGWLK